MILLLRWRSNIIILLLPLLIEWYRWWPPSSTPSHGTWCPSSQMTIGGSATVIPCPRRRGGRALDVVIGTATVALLLLFRLKRLRQCNLRPLTETEFTPSGMIDHDFCSSCLMMIIVLWEGHGSLLLLEALDATIIATMAVTSALAGPDTTAGYAAKTAIVSVSCTALGKEEAFAIVVATSSWGESLTSVSRCHGRLMRALLDLRERGRRFFGKKGVDVCKFKYY